MSKPTSEILNDLFGPRFHLDVKAKAELAKLAAVAENKWEAPSARIQARTALAGLYYKIAHEDRQASKAEA
jgi:hypothetical protein